MRNKSELALVLRHGRIYSIANVLNRGAGLVLLPVYLHVLTPAEFGVLALVTLTTDVLGVILGLGLGRALLRFYAGAKDDRERDQLIVSSLAMLLVLGAAFALLARPLAALSCQLIFGDLEHVTLFTLANIAIVFTVLFNFQVSCLIAAKASMAYLWASLAKTVLMLVVNIVLVVQLDMGVRGVVLGTLMSAVVVSGSLLIPLLRGRRLSIDVARSRELIVFAAPLIPTVLIDTVVAALDKLAVNRLGSEAAVGSYSTGQRVSGLLQMFVVQPFMQIWIVRLLEALDHQGQAEHRKLTRIFEMFLMLLCVAALGASLFAPEIVLIIAAPEYSAAGAVIPLLALAETMLLFRSCFEADIYHAKATKYLPRLAVVNLVLAVPVYAGLAYFFGIVGAAIAFAVLAATRASMVGMLAARVGGGAIGLINLKACAGNIGTAVLCYSLAVWLLPEGPNAVSIVMRLLVLPVYLLLLYFSPAFGDDGRKMLRASSRQLVRRFLGPGR